MKKLVIASIIAAVAAPVLAAQQGEMRFERKIDIVNGIKITRANGDITMSGESAKNRAAFEIVTNRNSGHEKVIFTMSESSNVTQGDITYTLNGRDTIRNNEGKALPKGEHELGAHMHTKSHENFVGGETVHSVVTVKLSAPQP